MRVALTRGRPGPMTVYAGALSTALLALARFWPFDRWPIVTCPLRTYAHLPCPACGMTRAFVHVMHGDLPAAFRVSPYGAVLCFLAIATLVYVALRSTVISRGFVIEASSDARRRFAYAAMALLGMNWVYLLVSGAAS